MAKLLQEVSVMAPRWVGAKRAALQADNKRVHQEWVGGEKVGRTRARVWPRTGFLEESAPDGTAELPKATKTLGWIRWAPPHTKGTAALGARAV